MCPVLWLVSGLPSASVTLLPVTSCQGFSVIQWVSEQSSSPESSPTLPHRGKCWGWSIILEAPALNEDKKLLFCVRCVLATVLCVRAQSSAVLRARQPVSWLACAVWGWTRKLSSLLCNYRTMKDFPPIQPKANWFWETILIQLLSFFVSQLERVSFTNIVLFHSANLNEFCIFILSFLLSPWSVQYQRKSLLQEGPWAWVSYFMTR